MIKFRRKLLSAGVRDLYVLVTKYSSVQIEENAVDGLRHVTTYWVHCAKIRTIGDNLESMVTEGMILKLILNK